MVYFLLFLRSFAALNCLFPPSYLLFIFLSSFLFLFVPPLFMSVSVRDGGHIKGCGSHVRGFSLTNTCTFYGLTTIVKPTTCLSFCVLFYSVFYSVLLLPMLFSFIICALPSHSSPFSLFFFLCSPLFEIVTCRSPRWGAEPLLLIHSCVHYCYC